MNINRSYKLVIFINILIIFCCIVSYYYILYEYIDNLSSYDNDISNITTTREWRSNVGELNSSYLFNTSWVPLNFTQECCCNNNNTQNSLPRNKTRVRLNRGGGRKGGVLGDRVQRSHDGREIIDHELPVDHEARSKMSSFTKGCRRPCVKGAPSLICRYHFVLEHYSTMGPGCKGCPTNSTDCFEKYCVTADGVDRGILTVNRRLPGPSIEVCEGDTVIVDVDNRMFGQETSIHWHGILQNGSPYMDGVPMLTQCPIMFGNTFRYNFEANEIGTYFWHSHDGFQKMDGLTGSLIVRTPRDPSRYHYDWDLSEHIIVLMDWLHQFTASRYPGPRQINRGQMPQAILINGRGRFRDPVTNSFNQIPLSEFRVKEGFRYRFRIIHAGCLVCPLHIQFENHKMHVIATDGGPVDPVEHNSLVILPGERYDVVIHANQPARPYWVHVKAVGECTASGNNIFQEAILRYEDAVGGLLSTSAGPDGYPHGIVMNALGAQCGPGENGVCVSQLRAQVPPPRPDPVLTTKNVIRIDIGIDFHFFTPEQLFNSQHFYRFFVPAPSDSQIAGRVNNISFLAPPAPPLSQPEVLRHLCSSGSPKCCKTKPSDPTHRECVNIYSVPLGSVVEMIFFDNLDTGGIISHPMHLHGYMFYVLEMGTAVDRALKRQDRQFNYLDNPYPAKKDTVTVPSGGYTRIRFHAKNPGYWFLHCHILIHLESGMAAVLRVGEQHHLPPVPKGFPRCGDFVPPCD